MLHQSYVVNAFINLVTMTKTDHENMEIYLKIIFACS